MTAKRYRVTYGSTSPNVEALLVNPVTGAKYLISKNLLSGTIYSLPSELSTDRANDAHALTDAGPSMVTDATFTVDGTHAVVRSYTSLFVLDPANWSQVGVARTPPQQQGETITAEKGTLLIGSEGVASELLRVPLPSVTPEPTPPPTATHEASNEAQQTIAPMLFVFGAVVAAGMIAAGVAIWVRRSH